ncbi:hypothetical protein HYX05_04190 [Candidatus Woesearchaeota archaeon]|nr:hypothetical protein [Candidatus Woesearchaeota archaeon]
MLELIVLRQEVAEAAGKIDQIDITRAENGILLRFISGIPHTEALTLVGKLLSGYYTEKSIQLPYSRLNGLRISFDPRGKKDRYQSETTYLLRSDFPAKGTVGHNSARYKYFDICYFNLRTIANNPTFQRNDPRWDYVLIFSRRDSDFRNVSFRHSSRLTKAEVRGFYDYVIEQQRLLQPHQ